MTQGSPGWREAPKLHAEQRQRLMQRLSGRMAQMPDDDPQRGRLFAIILRLRFGATTRDIHNINRKRGGDLGNGEV